MASLDDLKCPVCMEIFKKPYRTECGHSFCYDCLKQCAKNNQPCPGCRQSFSFLQITPNSELETVISDTTAPCDGCGNVIPCSLLQSHFNSCDPYIQLQGRLVKGLTVTEPKDTNPNRQTFHCPYCTQDHLAGKDLIEHCNTHHSRSAKQVVCPICASMPWGDPNQKSADFIQHLNHRHKFEYGTFVEYEADDDEMLRKAMELSKEQQ